LKTASCKSTWQALRNLTVDITFSGQAAYQQNCRCVNFHIACTAHAFAAGCLLLLWQLLIILIVIVYLLPLQTAALSVKLQLFIFSLLLSILIDCMRIDHLAYYLVRKNTNAKFGTALERCKGSFYSTYMYIDSCIWVCVGDIFNNQSYLQKWPSYISQRLTVWFFLQFTAIKDEWEISVKPGIPDLHEYFFCVFWN